MKKIISLLLFLSLAVFSYAEVDPIADFSNDSISILNEQLRKLDVDEKVRANSTDPDSGYLSDKVKNSIVIDSYDLQLSGDTSAPGNSKVYGTNATGTKGWKADPTGATSFWNNINSSSVFSGTMPQVWTDLNLSSIVGANYALAILKVGSADASGIVRFRKNGDSDEYGTVGADIATVSSSSAIVVCPTDSGGLVEWKADNAAAGAGVWVEGYIK